MQDVTDITVVLFAEFAYPSNSVSPARETALIVAALAAGGRWWRHVEEGQGNRMTTIGLPALAQARIVQGTKLGCDSKASIPFVT